jgi:hypothetical protein
MALGGFSTRVCKHPYTLGTPTPVSTHPHSPTGPIGDFYMPLRITELMMMGHNLTTSLYIALFQYVRGYPTLYS